jgi:dipeptidyl aminopeptidase/acylaminoacyl peptidase
MLPANRVYLSVGLSQPVFADKPDTLFYVRTADGKRTIVRQMLATGLAQPVTTEPAPAGGVGYGGGLYALQGDVLVYAAKGGRLVGLRLSTGTQWDITPAYEGVAGPVFSPCGQFVAFLAEQDGHCNVLLVDIAGKTLPVKISNDPWYAFNPTFAGDGRRLAWMEWDAQVMPWDEARLQVVTLTKPTARASATHQLLPTTQATISRPGASLASPQFSPGGKFLAYTSDESGWRSLVVAEAEGQNPVRVETGLGEIGKPDWVVGRVAVRWSADGRSLFTVRRHHARDVLLKVAWPEKTVSELVTGSTEIEDLHVRGDTLAYVGAGPLAPPAVFTHETSGRERGEVARASGAVGLLNPKTLSTPATLIWTNAEGRTLTAIHHPPVGGDGPAPTIIHIHGGPTSETPLRWDAQAQYFATRGWRYVSVNYRGSTGSGREFQDQLNGAWGLADVEDARSAAEHLVSAGLADADRLVITGGSAGGYTTLMALAAQPDFWAAGVSLFGIGRVYDLKLDAHRFEINYEETLIGKLPEHGPLWRQRSPLTFASQVKRPVLLFHGKEDKAVPYQQSVDFAEAIRRRGGEVELVLFDDEGHGFTREANRKTTLERTLAFLERVVINRQA